MLEGMARVVWMGSDLQTWRVAKQHAAFKLGGKCSRAKQRPHSVGIADRKSCLILVGAAANHAAGPPKHSARNCARVFLRIQPDVDVLETLKQETCTRRLMLSRNSQTCSQIASSSESILFGAFRHM